MFGNLLGKVNRTEYEDSAGSTMARAVLATGHQLDVDKDQTRLIRDEQEER